MIGTSAKEKQDRLLGLILLFGAAFITHIIFAAGYIGYPTDMQCFWWWALAVFENGPGEFYHLEAFTDYPPGYMYILWPIGALLKLCGSTAVTTFSAIIVKMPAMICDLLIGYVIYRIASKYTSHKYSMIFAAAYMFNPAVIINSATWGQVDSVLTIFIVLMIYFVTEKKLPAAYFIFAAGILIKPQAVIFTPVLIYGIIDQVFLNDFSLKRMFKQLGIGLAAIASMLLAVLPFGLEEVVTQYVKTLGQYQHASVNAYNLWALLGKNWSSQDDIFMFLPYRTWGTIFIILTVVVSAYFCLKNKEKESKYYLAGAFIITSVFMLAVRMHERYMYPALALLLIVCAVKRNYKYIFAYAFLSFVQFLNAYHVLFYYDAKTYEFGNPVIPLISALSICAFAYFLYVYFGQLKCKRAYTQAEMAEINAQKKANNQKNSSRSNRNNNNRNNNRNNVQNNRVAAATQEASDKKSWFSIIRSEKALKWTKWEIITVSVITVVYAGIAFFNLGGFEAPQSMWKSNQTGAEITVDLGEVRSVNHFFGYPGTYENRQFDVQLSDDGSSWTPLNYQNGEEDAGVVKFVSVFCWNRIDAAFDARYVKFIQKDDVAEMMEFKFYDAEGNDIVPVSATAPEVIDEQDTFDGVYSFMNSTYFDEIYHGRTAFEMINNMYCYENTHPPLGKAIIAIGILIFGMVPFGWRFMGTLFGVLMVPIMYLLGRKLTGTRWLATIMTLIFTFDFMHFTQTRIATIDVYVTLFIMLMYFFMLCYYKMSFYDTPIKKTYIPLLLSGICMGLGCASKWTGIYAGLGLAVIFAAVMIRRYGEYRTALKSPNGKSEGIEHKFIIDNYSSLTLKTLGFCVIAFVVVPFIIYLCAYIPFSDGSSHNLFVQMIDNQRQMFSYHAGLDATHPYESTWYQWPVIKRPILYYLESIDGTLKAGISAMGNPFVWWAGIPAFLYMLYLAIAKKDRTSLFIAIGYLAQYLPWMLVSRCTFIYHYFPSVPFVVLMIGYSIYKLTKDRPKLRIAALVYTVLVVALFFVFYPVLSGYPTTDAYVTNLKWLNDWVLLF